MLDRIDAVTKREVEVAMEEASFAEQSTRLTERELNAEQSQVAARYAFSLSDLQSEKEIHKEDCAALERMIKRLVTERTEKLHSEAEGQKNLLADARSDRDAYWK